MLLVLQAEGVLISNTIKALNPDEVMGINTRYDLSRAEKVIRQGINHNWMLSGVTIIDPRDNIYR